ncbi:MAG: hypothetical protein NTZ21_17855 [Actinobacteria bacterium]|nr:hypothetical protein [Actinomycetota bacterium]
MRTFVGAVVALVLACGSHATVGAAPSGGALIPAHTLVISTWDTFEVPFDAAAVALNVTVTEPTAAGFLTVYPCGQPRPLASNLNYVAGQTVPNFVISAVGEYGSVCIDTMVTTDVVVDLAGYVPAGSDLVMLAAPQRFLDTREPASSAGTRLRAGEVRSVRIGGTRGIPVDARAVVFNATAVAPSARGYLTVFPCGQPLPATSTLNAAAGSVVPNLVMSALGPDGTVCLFANVDMDVVGDVAGYVPRDSTGVTLLPAPRRILDTRTGLGGPAGPLTAVGRRIDPRGQLGVPTLATAAIVNLTATEGTAPGWIAAFPCVQNPLTSNLNFGVGQDVANMAIVGFDNIGICLRSNQPVHVVVDLVGYVNGTDSIVAISPQRLYDSRDGVDPVCRLGISSRDGRWTWTDLYSGSTGATVSALLTPATSRPLDISADCRTARFVGGDTLFEVDRTGRIVRSVSTTVPSTPIGTERSTPVANDAGDFGVAVRMNPAPDRFSLWELTEPYEWATIPLTGPDAAGNLLGVDRDLTTLVFWRWNDRQQPEIRQYDAFGEPFGGVGMLPVAAEQLSLSPSALYIAFRRQLPRPGGFGTEVTMLEVAALDGTPVASLPLAFGSSFLGTDAIWMTDGSLLLCARTGGLFATSERPVRWDLFSPPQLMFPDRTDVACPVVAR